MAGGRPLKFPTVEILQEKIDAYFNSTPKKEWTITGLALALDTSRQTLCEYKEREEFIDSIKKAVLMVEHSYEVDLKEKGNTGTIFALKNFDWKDRSEVDQRSVNVHFSKDGKDMTDEELLQIAKS